MTWTAEMQAELDALEAQDAKGGRAPSKNPPVEAIDEELRALELEEADYQKQKEGTAPEIAKKGQGVLSDLADRMTSPSNIMSFGMLKNIDKSLGKDISGTVDKKIFQAMDYLGGIGGTAVSDLVTKPDAVTWNDYKDAFKGSASKPSKFLERGGTEAGKSLSDMLPIMYSEDGVGMPLKKGGDWDPNSRDAKGFLISMLGDPLNYLGLGAKGLRSLGMGAKGAAKGAAAATGTALANSTGDAARLSTKVLSKPEIRILDDAAKAANRSSKDILNQSANVMEDAREAMTPLAKGLKAVGKSWYRSPFKGVEAKAAKDFNTKGMKKLSDVLFENDIWGGAQSIANQADELVKNMGGARNKLYDQIKKPVNLNNPKMYKNFKAGALNDMPNPLRREGIRDAADELKTLVQGLPQGKAPVKLASEISSDLTKISPTAYQKRAVYNSSKAARSRIAKDIKNEIYDLADEARPNMSEEIRYINKNFEPILKSRKGLDAMGTRDAGRKAFSQIDAMLLGGGAASTMAGQALKNPWMGALPLLMFGGKKAAQMAGSTRGATLGGLALKKLGKTSLWDNILREMLVKEKLDNEE